MGLAAKRKDKAGDDDVSHGDGKKKLPAEAHELVVTETRKRGAHPDVEQEKAENLRDKPEDREDGGENWAAEVVGQQMAERTGRAAEEEQRSDAGYGDHVGVLGHKEHGELHRGILGVVSGDEFGFGFGQVEGGAVGLGVGGHEVDEEGDELEAAEDVPAPRTVGRLAVDDVAKAERSCAENDADERKAQGELVADHLRGSAEAAEESELIVRRPAGECDAVDADGGDAEDDEQADVEVGNVEHVDGRY